MKTNSATFQNNVRRQRRAALLFLAVTALGALLFTLAGCGGGGGKGKASPVSRERGTITVNFRWPETAGTGRDIPDKTKHILVRLVATGTNETIQAKVESRGPNSNSGSVAFNNVVKADDLVVQASTFEEKGGTFKPKPNGEPDLEKPNLDTNEDFNGDGKLTGFEPSGQDLNNNGVPGEAGEDLNGNGILDTVNVDLLNGYAFKPVEWGKDVILDIKPFGVNAIEIKQIPDEKTDGTQTGQTSPVVVEKTLTYQVSVKDLNNQPITDKANLPGTFAVSVTGGGEVVPKPYGGTVNYNITQAEPDLNGNGSADPAEDQNKNGRLDGPGKFMVKVTAADDVTINATYSFQGVTLNASKVLDAEASVADLTVALNDALSGKLLQKGTGTITVALPGYVNNTKNNDKIKWYFTPAGGTKTQIPTGATGATDSKGTKFVINNPPLSVTMTGGKVGGSDLAYTLEFKYSNQPEKTASVTVSGLSVVIRKAGSPPTDFAASEPLKVGQSVSLVAVVTGAIASESGVNWSPTTNLGSVTANGAVLTGPGRAGAFTITATSKLDSAIGDSQDFSVGNGTVNAIIQ